MAILLSSVPSTDISILQQNLAHSVMVPMAANGIRNSSSEYCYATWH